MHKGYLKTSVFIAAGILTGTLFAAFKTPDYRHAMVALKGDKTSRPISIGNYGGKQVLALTIKNLRRAGDVEIRMDGADIKSWFPPVVKMPFYKGIEAEGGRFREIKYGRRVPAYLTISNLPGCGEIGIYDPSDGSLIQTVHVMKGGADGGRH